MSIFEGVLKELPNVSIDRFNGENLKSTCFFLSHCHSDHMHGLRDVGFACHLRRSKDYFIYCSPISALILNSSGVVFEESHVKEITGTIVIKVPASESCPVDYDITVTAIPAGHCPGSVMFLFETAHESYLYTGDFRFAEGDIEKFALLRTMNSVKKIDKLYFDATFLNEKYWKFPSRKESLDEIITLIYDWFEKDPKNSVHLETSARYGCEYLFIEVAKEFKCKIYVEDAIFNLYWNVPDIGCILTNKTDESKIHVHARLNDSSCGDRYVLHIRISAQWYRWSKNGSEPKISCCRGIGRKFFQVCFATHSSCSELVEFLNYLKPKSLHACTSVVGLSEDGKKNYIIELKKSWEDDDEIEKSTSESVTTPKTFEKFYLNNSPLKIKVPKNSESEKKLLDSPPIRRQRLSLNKSIL